MEEKCICQCEKATVRSEEERKKLINRLNRIEGNSVKMINILLIYFGMM